MWRDTNEDDNEENDGDNDSDYDGKENKEEGSSRGTVAGQLHRSLWPWTVANRSPATPFSLLKRRIGSQAGSRPGSRPLKAEK